MRVLVGYASVHSSTREIAHRIANRLRLHGLEVECAAISSAPDVAHHDAVVLGSAIHNAAWLPEASAFVSRETTHLATRPVWLFSVGMPAGLGPIVRRVAARSETDKVTAPFRAAVHPRGERLFSGVFLREHTSVRAARIFRLLGGRFGDYRDWIAIDGWADEIAADLALPGSPNQAARAGSGPLP